LTNKSKPIIKHLDFSEEKLNEVKKIRTSKFSPQRKKERVRRLIGVGPCCICGSLPNLVVTSEVGDKEQSMIRNEFFCQTCYETEQNRAKEGSLYYDCIKSEFTPE